VTAGMGDDMIGTEEAAEILGVPAEQVPVLAEEGVLTPQDDGAGGQLYARSEVMAARLLGG
jgi:CO/xanthine dehydrogenase Mo-binding subunit